MWRTETSPLIRACMQMLLLQLNRAQNVLTIPVEALVLKGRQETVYVLDDANRIHIRNVGVGTQGFPVLRKSRADSRRETGSLLVARKGTSRIKR